MKYVRGICCFLFVLIIFAWSTIYAAETELDVVPEMTQGEVASGISDPPEDNSNTDNGWEAASASGEDTVVETGETTPDKDSGNGNNMGPDGGSAIQMENTSEPENEPKPDDAPESDTEQPDYRDPMFGLSPGEEITICVHVSPGDGDDMLRAAASDTTTVKVKVLEVYEYDHAGLGDGTGMFTNKYQVTFNGMKAIAYCLEPAKQNPKMSDNFTILKYSDGKSVAKILYYAQADAAHNGYFALKHPGYSDEKKFIITHMAAAKAAGSSSWDQHATKEAKKEANALIDYVESMPAIQDPEISFSPASLTASLQGNVLQTGKATLIGSTGNTAEVTLPAGVELKNQTNAARSGTGKVTLAAGDSFTLNYSLPAQSSLSVKVSAVGKQDRDYSAYKIKTDSDTQNLGLIFGEAITSENKASLTAQFTPDVKVTPCKTDSNTGNGIQGAEFGLYAGEDMTEAGGKQWKQDERIESITTGADGKATFTHALTVGLDYYVKEDKAPAGYQLNPTGKRMPVVYKMESGSGSVQNIEQVFKNDPVKGEIRLYKRDRELSGTVRDTGKDMDDPEGEAGSETEAETVQLSKAQGDATLEGARYGLYAGEDILHPDKSGKVLYSADELVAEALTDGCGEIIWKDLPLGKYYIKEIEPSEGYVLDETEYEAQLAWADGDTSVILTEVTVAEQVKKQAFQLRKFSERNDADPVPIAGAGFKAWLVSSLKKTGDSYDVSDAEPAALCEDGTAELFTNEQGRAVSIPLPYGTYLVRETTVPDGHIPVQDFLVHITENSPDTPQSEITLKDRKVMGQIRIIKTGPMLTGYRKGEFIYEVRGLAGAVFEVKAGEDIYRTDTEGYENGEPVILYQEGQTVSSLTTDSSGEAVSEELPLGKYVVRETTAPYGTVLMTDSYEVVLAPDGEIPVVVKDIKVEDPKQEIVINAVKCSNDSKQIPLKGAEFTLYAGENIYARSEDGRTAGKLLVSAGTALAAAKSEKGGKAVFKLNLPNAKYYVMETKAPSGYQLNTKKYDCDCSYIDQTKKTIRISLKVPDEPLMNRPVGTTSASPKTGDHTPILLLLTAMIASIGVAGICIGMRKLRRVRSGNR